MPSARRTARLRRTRPHARRHARGVGRRLAAEVRARRRGAPVRKVVEVIQVLVLQRLDRIELHPDPLQQHVVVLWANFRGAHPAIGARGGTETVRRGARRSDHVQHRAQRERDRQTDRHRDRQPDITPPTCLLCPRALLFFFSHSQFVGHEHRTKPRGFSLARECGRRGHCRQPQVTNCEAGRGSVDPAVGAGSGQAGSARGLTPRALLAAATAGP